MYQTSKFRLFLIKNQRWLFAFMLVVTVVSIVYGIMNTMKPSKPEIRNTGVNAAIVTLKNKIKQFPNNALLYSNLGYAYEELRDYKKARVYYQKALSINPNFTVAEYNYSFSFFKSGEAPKALKLLQKLSEKKPDFIEAKLAIARIHLKNNQANEAISVYQDIIEKKPDFIQGYFSLAAAYIKLKKNAEAKQALNNFISKFKNSSDSTSKRFVEIAKMKLDIIKLREKLHERRINRQN